MVNIAIEGPVCAGKTTLIEQCQKSGMLTVQEYREYVLAASQNFGRFPPRSVEEAKQNFLSFF